MYSTNENSRSCKQDERKTQIFQTLKNKFQTSECVKKIFQSWKLCVKEKTESSSLFHSDVTSLNFDLIIT